MSSLHIEYAVTNNYFIQCGGILFEPTPFMNSINTSISMGNIEQSFGVSEISIPSLQHALLETPHNGHLTNSLNTTT